MPAFSFRALARLACCASLLLSAAVAPAADWPQFHGPKRDNCSTETGLLPTWPNKGPKMLWQIGNLGTGYSSVAIAGSKLLTMGDRNDVQQVICIDLASQKELWATKIGPMHKDGPRCTPTIDGNFCYAIGTDGDLACFDLSSGKIRWAKNFARDFGGQMMSQWKFSESPLLDGDRVICTPGGPKAAMVALDKKTGFPKWRAALPKLGDKGRDGAGYSSIVPADINGVRQYVQMMGRGIVSIEASSGKFLWGYNRVANAVANITAPIVRDNYVFCTTSYKTGSALLKIAGGKKGPWKAEEVWWLDYTEFANHHGGVVLVGNYLYGGDGQNSGVPKCLEFETGKIAWKGEAAGKRSAAITYADGHVYFRYEDGVVALVKASPDGYQADGLLQTAPIDSGPAWAHPVIVDKKIYLRHGNILSCFDLGS